eukprot:IDg13876t1
MRAVQCERRPALRAIFTLSFRSRVPSAESVSQCCGSEQRPVDFPGDPCKHKFRNRAHLFTEKYCNASLQQAR